MNSSGHGPRRHLLDEMAALQEQGIHCGACPGHCCTFQGNSVQITPEEALDLMGWLRSKGRWNRQLEQRLQEVCDQYRLLSPPPGDGRRTFSRRTYTCPFYEGERDTLRCTIDPQVKPWGCLAFNPGRAGESSGESCASRQDLLRRIDEIRTPSSAGQDLLPPGFREKAPLPVFLLHLLRHPPAEGGDQP